MILEMMNLIEGIVGELANGTANLPWPIHDLLAYFTQITAMMGGFDIVALLFLAGLAIGILASMAYVALKIT